MQGRVKDRRLTQAGETIRGKKPTRRKFLVLKCLESGETSEISKGGTSPAKPARSLENLEHLGDRTPKQPVTDADGDNAVEHLYFSDAVSKNGAVRT